MKNTYLLYLSFTFYCLFFLSCTNDINNTEFINDQNKSNITDLIEYAKEQYAKSLSTNKAQNEPQWFNYQILKQTNNDIMISIPIKNNSGDKYNNLIVNQTKSNNRLLLIKEPKLGFDTLPINIRRRIIFDENGESRVCRSIVDELGQLKFVRVRDVPTTRSTINGGTLPEVVIYPGGLDYETNWWWWDYITGLISIPPPEDYFGYTGSNSQQIRPDYYKVSNISKDATVQNSMKIMFQNTKNDASKLNGRRERGFWVYYDTKTEKYYTGNEKIGQYVKGNIGTNGSISPGGSLPHANGNHIPSSAIPVTFIHTHTPLTYENNCQREVGLSQADIDYADKNNIEIIVIDYVGVQGADGKYYIQAGHNINDATKEYVYTPKK